jgi:eukaryotic-like serine/threonine-protein kinase
MTLAMGTKLGSYEVTAEIGKGGMGEVYRARDAKLGRDVAIKVLPASFARDAERMARFEREAKVLASLDHPNIASIYGVEDSGATLALVMQLAEGPTLADRIAQGPIPIDEALRIARQIADALEYAHERGVVHRDLKPANIKISRDDAVKVLDFGLAKAVEGDASSMDMANSPTLTHMATQAGVLLGTAAYMSPEQGKAKPVDRRADIWAFGCVLYEMLTGKMAFSGETVSDTLAAIIKEEPDWSQLPKGTPTRVRVLLQRCLQKDPKQRLRDIGDARISLDEVISGAPELPAVKATPLPSTRRRAIFGTVGTVGLLIVGTAAYFLGRSATTGFVPSYQQLTFDRGTIYQARFAPDGQTIYYSAAWDGQPAGVYSVNPSGPESRSLGLSNSSLFAVSASQLAISVGCHLEFLGVCEGTLATVPITGGAPREIADHVLSADWMPGGNDLAAIRESNGEFQVEFPLGKVIYKSQTWLNFLRISPQGDRVAFARYSIDGADIGSVMILDHNGRQLARSEQYASVEGLVWRPSDDQVWFAGSSPNSGWADQVHALTVTGKDRILMAVPAVLRIQDISSDGHILLTQDQWRMGLQYKGPKDVAERDFSWLDGAMVSDLSQDGQELAFGDFMEASGPGGLAYVRTAEDSSAVKLGIGLYPVLSPDGKWALVGAYDPPHLALLPTGTGEARSLKPYSLQQLQWQGWMPDGRSVYFAGNDGHDWRMYVQALDGGAPRAVTPAISVSASQALSDLVSPDGKFVFARDLDGKGVLYPLAGGPARSVPGLLPADIWVNWSSDGKSIYVYQDDVTRAQLFRLDLSTGKRELLRTLAPPDIAGLAGIESLRITADGQTYAYSYNRALSALYLIRGLQ